MRCPASSSVTLIQRTAALPGAIALPSLGMPCRLYLVDFQEIARNRPSRWDAEDAAKGIQAGQRRSPARPSSDGKRITRARRTNSTRSAAPEVLHQRWGHPTAAGARRRKPEIVPLAHVRDAPKRLLN